MKVERFLLASRSPQRVRLLTDAGFDFEAVPADIDEQNYPSNLAPADVAVHLAHQKAAAIFARYPGRIVLGADTTVNVGATLLGKPIDKDDARRMMRLLSGGAHHVVTGVALLIPESAPVLITEISVVEMRALSSSELTAYLAAGQWYGKAGGYGIQDRDPFVTCVNGSSSNVIGLPMERVTTLLAAAGIHARN